MDLIKNEILEIRNNKHRAKITEKINGVFLFTFKTRLEMCATFLRLQEYYECPKFRGKIFSLEEYALWYKKENGEFSYCNDWDGMNVPSYVLKPFKDKSFNPCKVEKSLLDSIKNKTKEMNKFYLIAVNEGSGSEDYIWECIKHELAHAMFYINDEYKLEVLNVLNTIPINVRNIIKGKLLNGGYTDNVVEDETHAYLIDYYYMNDKDFSVYEKSVMKKKGEILNKIFDKYMKLMEK